MASLSRNYDQKKLLGQVYTPKVIVDKILSEVGIDSPDFLGKRILDPACGDGRFLLEIVKRIVAFSPSKSLRSHLEKIQGWDVDKVALDLCRKNLNRAIEKTGFNINWNLKNRDALQEISSNQKFDYVVGNPPYIRIQHLPVKLRDFLQSTYSFCKSGSTDIYVAFFELSVKLLNEEGLCAFITPNSYFTSETARPLRQYFQEKKNVKLITNYGPVRVFEDVGTYSAITVFGGGERGTFKYELSDAEYSYRSRDISFEELKKNDPWQLSVKPPAADSGNRLGDICQVSVGLTTLSDRNYLFEIAGESSQHGLRVVSKADKAVIIERMLLKPIVKASRLKSSEDPITEYILFPYRKNDQGKQVIIPEQELAQNYPRAYSYLLSIKDALNKRDNGKPNPVAWYAFGRAQALDSCFGKKIIFSPMNKSPKFILYENAEAAVYSGYFIKYDGNYEKLLLQLNSNAMANYMEIAGRDFRGGWKGYTKKIVDNFRVDPESLIEE